MRRMAFLVVESFPPSLTEPFRTGKPGGLAHPEPLAVKFPESIGRVFFLWCKYTYGKVFLNRTGCLEPSDLVK
jgi:hypothetical protein